MDANVELLKVGSGFGLVGIVAVVLGLKFMKTAEAREARMQLIADDDRKWRNEQSEKLTLLLSDLTRALSESTNTNKSLTESNLKLVARLEPGK